MAETVGFSGIFVPHEERHKHTWFHWHLCQLLDWVQDKSNSEKYNGNNRVPTVNGCYGQHIENSWWLNIPFYIYIPLAIIVPYFMFVSQNAQLLWIPLAKLLHYMEFSHIGIWVNMSASLGPWSLPTLKRQIVQTKRNRIGGVMHRCGVHCYLSIPVDITLFLSAQVTAK